MIRVLGAEETAEHEAALQLRDHLVRAWPDTVGDPDTDVRIVAGAKCHGQDVQDIDVLLLADFGPGVAFRPLLPFTTPSG
ncbi:MAG: hypothetical protein M3R02_29610 [Chloroflexota bacterium]|nr:hypothetical protein [Chloroflexota bacterium]